MPQDLRYTETIAIEKERGVLIVCFGPRNHGLPIPIAKMKPELKQARDELIAFLDKNKIGYEECFPTGAQDFEVCPYDGTLYIDVEYNSEDTSYRTFIATVEKPDGTQLNPEVTCYYVSFEQVLKKLAELENAED